MSDVNEFEEDQGDIFGTVYGDMITFVAVLFMVLFMLVFNETQDKTFFAKMNVAFGGKKIEQTKEVSSEGLYVKSLEDYVLDEDLSQYAMVLVSQTRVKLVINDPILFKPGSAKLERDAIPILHGFAGIITQFKNPIVIEGYTDQVPGSSVDSKQNWMLATERAYAVLRFFVDEAGVSPKRLSIQSFGPYLPIKDNATSQTRAQNRRVEITIIRVSEAIY